MSQNWTLAFMLAATTWSVPAREVRNSDPVAESMFAMRQVASALDAYRAYSAALPLADGSVRPLSSVVRLLPRTAQHTLPELDGWRRPTQYRALRLNYELISFGADGRPERDYGQESMPYGSRFLEIVEAADPANDLVLIDARFVRRPFGGRGREFQTINAINKIFMASASFAVDNNRYPGDSSTWFPITALRGDLVPTYIADLPETDGWGRPIVYANVDGRIAFASFGSDGSPDTGYAFDLPCGVAALDGQPSPSPGADVVQICGDLIVWPAGTEP